jgi:hypothetical protein
MQTNPNTTTTTPATPPAEAPAAVTDEQKIARAESLMRNCYMLADDEAHPALTWGDRDDLARQLHEAMQLIREVHLAQPQQEPRAH